MAGMELFSFQQEAADKIAAVALNYYVTGPDKMGGRPIPFVGQLKAVTGAGKTPVLAKVIGTLNPALILWTTKFGSVVDQTVANLRLGGKYHHLLGRGPVEVIKFSDIGSPAAWHQILEAKAGVTILVSTVAAWYTSETNDRLNVHRVNPDWGDKSRWEQLKTQRARPLWIVYDEAHNTTTEQVEFLDELGPSGFFVASASGLKGKLQLYLTNLPEEVRKERIVPVSTRAVVDAQLLKSTISIADYDSPVAEMLADVAARRDDLEKKLKALGRSTIPKAIYVVETSNPTAKGGDPRPVALWKVLVQQCKVKPESIAICTNTKDLPKDAIRVDTIDQLTPEHKHIIFNKKLQEGWDDPSVYVCYFDGKTESANRIQQVVGRALRQPGAKHLPDEDLNTAFFFLNCPNEAMEKIIDQLKEELHIYKGDDAPDDFEPFKIKEERRALARIKVKSELEGKLRVPRLQIEMPLADRLRKFIERKTIDFGDEDRAAGGRALVSVVSVRSGEVSQNTRDLLEDMQVRCGVYLQDQIRALSKDCLNAIHPATFSNQKLDKPACLKSKALEYYRGIALEVVRDYETQVQIEPLADESEATYVVGAYQPSGTIQKSFDHAAHPYYDNKAMNEDEIDVARALDKWAEYIWTRNRPRLDYGIPLPVKSGGSSVFYPDFLWWVRDTVWAIDPTGKFILEEKIRTKLLSVPAPLRIALITRGQYDSLYRKTSPGGWTLVRQRVGNPAPEVFEQLDDLLAVLVEGSGGRPDKAADKAATHAKMGRPAKEATKAKKAARLRPLRNPPRGESGLGHWQRRYSIAV